MDVRLDFKLGAWIRDLHIEANSVDEAIEKLYKMSAEDLLKGKEFYIQNHTVDDIEPTVEWKEVEVSVTNIKYDTDDIHCLPTEMTLYLGITPESLSIFDLVKEALMAQAGVPIKSFSYKVLKEF